MVEVGEKAPHFALYDTEGSLRMRSDFKDESLILLFFPLAFSEVCTQEMNRMQELIKDINSLDARVVGISTDSVYALAEFKKRYKYEFDFLSDYNKETSRAYGALYSEFVYGMKGVSRRAVFVMDPKGVIIHEEIMDDPGELPNFEAIQTSLKQVKAVKDEG